MRKPEVWLAAALYDTARRAMPTLCNNMGCRPVHWEQWNHVPTEMQQLFIEFAKGILTGVQEYTEETKDAVTKGETEREQEA